MPDTPRNYIRLAGSERRPGPTARLLGPAEDTETVTVTVMIRRRPDGPPVPDASYYLNTPPSQRRRLSQEDFAAKYGADPADVEKVVDFAQSHGLVVTETNLARRTVVVSGTVAQFNEAFAVELGSTNMRSSQAGDRCGAPRPTVGGTGFIYIPRALNGIIVGVFGLDNRRISKRASADPPNTTTISFPEVTQLYDFPANFAAGQTIAILSEDGYAWRPAPVQYHPAPRRTRFLILSI